MAEIKKWRTTTQEARLSLSQNALALLVTREGTLG
jgi:hypothetical protein